MEGFGFLWRDDPEGWDPYGWFSGYWIYGSEPDQIDPSLNATVAEEFIISYERALAPHTSIELSYVDKKTTDIIEDTCNGNWPEVAASPTSRTSAGTTRDSWRSSNPAPWPGSTS